MRRVTRAPAQPLPEDVRRPLSKQLRRPLEHIKVHADANANAVSLALGAQAWAYGDHIGFTASAWNQGGADGRQRIAHEAVHTLQQQGGPAVLAFDDPPRGVSFYFSVRVDREMGAEALLVEVIRQYSDLETNEEAEAAIAARNWHWSGDGQTVEAEDVRRGYILVRLQDLSLTALTPEERSAARSVVGGLDESERQSLYDEVDRRFWEQTHYQPGERLGDSADDRRMAEHWLVVRDNLVRARQSILDLPEHVRALLFDPEATRRLSPADYDVALRVGLTLAAMSVTELADWASRTNAVTDDWATFEASVQAYLEQEATRREEQLDLGQRSAALFGREELYALTKLVDSTADLAGLPSYDEAGIMDRDVVRAESELPELRSQLQLALNQNGFANRAEFEAAIKAWRAGFERETVRISDVMLDRLDHMLFEQQRRYGDDAEATGLTAAVARSGAPSDFATAARHGEAAIWRPLHAMDEGGFGGSARERQIAEAAAASAAAERTGRAAIGSLAGEHPLVAFDGFPVRRLARASEGSVQGIMLEFISDQRAAVEDTRSEIHGDSDFIYRLDQLLAASMAEQGITTDSIFGQIISDHISDRGLVALLAGIAVAVVAIALTIVSLGTAGPIAIGAGAAAFGLSAWQAWDAFTDYLRESDAHDARLLSEDPSIAWVVLAIAGAAVDMGGVLAAVRALRPAVVAFNEFGDLAAFREALEAASGVETRVLRAIERGAEAEAAFQVQVRAIGAMGSRANDVLGVVAEGSYRLMVMAWHLGRRGFWRFEQYLAELARVGVIGRIEDLTGPELVALRGPYDEGLRRAREGFLDPSVLSAELRGAMNTESVDTAAAYGRFIGLTDGEVQEVLELQVIAARADADALSPEALRQAMRARGGYVDDVEAVADVRGLPESGTRTVGAIEQTHDIGVAEGRRLLQGLGWREWGNWINPREFYGRYGQGIDALFVDGSGRLWIVEYKGGGSTLAGDQMTLRWVRDKIQELHDADYDFAADPIEAALKPPRTLRGIVISTPHGEPARVIRRFHY
ncbi:MAG: DUF4157 domain-containing protein [bacterium]|nr:DUF4157 domain-containing protein [bacterium]